MSESENFIFLPINAIKFDEGLDRQDLPRYRALTVVAEAADGHIAQLVEQLTLNQRVVGSIPTVPTIFLKRGPYGPFFLHQASLGLSETFHRRFS